jgi:hypothetical protein
MKQQRFAKAEQVYREDLARLPENGWLLLGLAQSLRKQNKNAREMSITQARYEKLGQKPISRSPVPAFANRSCEPRGWSAHV